VKVINRRQVRKAQLAMVWLAGALLVASYLFGNYFKTGTVFFVLISAAVILVLCSFFAFCIAAEINDRIILPRQKETP